MRTAFSLAAFLLTLSAAAQISGNQAYRNQNRYGNEHTPDGNGRPVVLRDSLLLVSANLLHNARADSLVVTFGLSEEAPTVKAALAGINSRLAAFQTGLRKLGVPDDRTYVDFITQTKVYDFQSKGMEADQYLKGFEVKKNILVTIPATGFFDRVVELAAEQRIYDLIKVDYVVSNAQKIYAEMMDAAADLAAKKKARYLGVSPVNVPLNGRLTYENFHAVYPADQYKSYEAFESSDVAVEYGNAVLLKRLKRKDHTFYYDKIDQSDFDLVINNSSPVVGVQYVLRVQWEFPVKK